MGNHTEQPRSPREYLRRLIGFLYRVRNELLVYLQIGLVMIIASWLGPANRPLGRVLMVILASVLFVGTGSLSLGTKLPDSSLRRSRMMHLLAPVCASFVLFLLLKPYGSPQSRSTGVVLVDPGTGRHEVQNLLPGSTVVIPARFEADYLVKTIFYTFEYTPPDLLAEILVVDDNSEYPLEPLVVQSFEEGGVLQSLTPEQKAKIRILRLPQREGLIRAKIIGADSARGTYILFLDGHCRVVPGYMQSMINMITRNGYKTIVTPIVTNVNGTSWEHMSLSGGAKMMFEWNFEFYWFEDNNDEVPIAVGGIQLMTKRWWTESGGYDQGMLDWGGENIEQSLRVWMCGGKILVDRQAKIGHIFQRPAPKNKVRSGQVQRNHARAALLYLDEKLSWFLDNHAAAKSEISKHQLGPHIGDRLAVRHSLQCKSFDEGFMERFWSVFENQALLLDKVHLIKHKRSRLCLALIRTTKDMHVKDVNAQAELRLKPCDPRDSGMLWMRGYSGTRVVNKRFNKCIDRGNKPFGRAQVIAFACDRHNTNVNQRWYWDNGRLYSPNRGVSSFRAPPAGMDEDSKGTLCISGPAADGKQLEVSPQDQTDPKNDLLIAANKYPKVFMIPCQSRSTSGQHGYLPDLLEFEAVFLHS